MVKESYKLSEFDRVKTKKTDAKGRVNLGSDMAETAVFVAAIDVSDTIENGVRPPQNERETLSNLTRWAVEHNFSIADYDVENGRILTPEAEWIETDVEGIESGARE